MSQWTHPGDDAVITFVDAHSDDEADDEEPGPPPEYAKQQVLLQCVNSGRLATLIAGGEKETTRHVASAGGTCPEEDRSDPEGRGARGPVRPT